MASVDLKKITIGQLAGAPSNERLIGQIFDGTKYKVDLRAEYGGLSFSATRRSCCRRPSPATRSDGDLKKLKGNTAYLNRLIDANIEGYRAIKNAGHEILPKDDAEFEGAAYRKTCLRFFKLMCATSLGKICASDHAMNAVDEMSALNCDLKAILRRARREISRVAGA